MLQRLEKVFDFFEEDRKTEVYKPYNYRLSKLSNRELTW